MNEHEARVWIKKNRDLPLLHTVNFHDVPIFRGLALCIADVEAHGAPVAIFSADRRDATIKRFNRKYGTNLHGQQYLYDNQGRPGFNPANSPSTTSHCLRADGNAFYRNSRHRVYAPGARMPWHLLGIDLSDKGKSENVSRFLHVAHMRGYHFGQPYPVGGERHHVVCATSPVTALVHNKVIAHR